MVWKKKQIIQFAKKYLTNCLLGKSNKRKEKTNVSFTISKQSKQCSDIEPKEKIKRKMFTTLSSTKSKY